MRSNIYSCTCDTYFRHGVICRHIFALSNLNQDKNLDKFLINNRWKAPILENLDNKMDIDHYTFAIQEIVKDLYNEKAENNPESISFQVNKKSKGAPKKEKRLKSITEKNSQKSLF